MADGARAILQSTVTCPSCGHAKRESMPDDHCLYFYTCTGCRQTLRPLQGHCCVFCSYGDAPCPPRQRDRF